MGDERSITNAVCQILAIGLSHYALSWARSKSRWLARLVDGTPLILLEHGQWRSDTLQKMRIEEDDVMFSARDHGLKTLEDIELAVLERNGDISVGQVEQETKR